MARPLEDWMIPLIKGMILREDDQSDIAACFLINSGRVAEVNTGQRSPEVKAASPEDLPPVGPYPSAYELWKAQSCLWAARVALQGVQEKIEQALVAVENAENRVKSK
jgi:hypothetical protein